MNRRIITPSKNEGVEPMSTEQNKMIVRRIFDEIFNTGDAAAADHLVAPDLVEHAAVPLCATGPETIKQVAAWCQITLPDVHFCIDDMVAEGDRVMVRLTLTGTNQGELQWRPPTGKRIAQPQLHVFRLFDGKMVDNWEVRDDLGMMQQLGVVPAHGQ